MIEQISQVMARLLMLKSIEERQEALLVLEEYYGKLMLPPVKLLLRMSDEELLSLLSVNGTPDLDKAVGLGLLLKEEGRIHEALEQYEESSARFNKSLYLFICAARSGADVAGVDCPAAVEELRELLRTYRIPGSTLKLLVSYYEAEGQYASAEDVLFELLETERLTDSSSKETGERFFDRIMKMPDDSLEQGGLPRHEAEQGVRDLHKHFEASE
jgi:tetratricopeptide (TPR) repeat protein